MIEGKDHTLDTMIDNCDLPTRIIMTIGTIKVQTAAEVGLALIQQLDEQNEQLSIKHWYSYR